MAIGTPAIVGSLGIASTSGSFAISSTTGAIATHDVVLVCHFAATNTGTASALTDTSGNAYVNLPISTFNTGTALEVWACFDAIAMTTGNAITATLSGGTTRHGLYAVNVSGMVNARGVWDVHSGLLHDRSTGTSSSLAVGNAAAAQMVMIGFCAGASAFGTFTPGSGWTAMTPLTTNAQILPQYQIVSGTTPITYGPSWVNSVLHTSVVGGFVGIPAATVNRQVNLGLLGVGA